MDDFFDKDLHEQRSQHQSAKQAEEAENTRRIKDETPEAVELFIQLCLEGMKTAFANNEPQFHLPMWESESSEWQEVVREYPHGHHGIAKHELEIARRISETTGRVVVSGAPGLVLVFDSSTAQKRDATQAITKKVLAGIAQMKAGKIKLYEGLSRADQDELERLYPKGYKFVEPYDVISVVKKSGDSTWQYSTRRSNPYGVILPEEEDEKGKKGKS